MSKKSKKKVITTVKRPKTENRISATVSKTRTKATVKSIGGELLFGMETFKWMGIGIGFMALGYILMLGGNMPDANTWDPDIIYSFRRTVLAPLMILIGLVLNIYAIFKK